MTDVNDLAYWFPKIDAAGLPVPATVVLTTDVQMMDVLDGITPKGWRDLIALIEATGDALGWPLFLRTGHGSAKHHWRDTCYVPSADAVEPHVVALVEWSACADLMGLPTHTWAIRQLIPTVPLFTCGAWGDFPVTREFRWFVRDSEVEHVQPYWPPDAVADARPSSAHWLRELAAAAVLSPGERLKQEIVALAAVAAVGGGYWSVDLLQDAEGEWWLTDMADGAQSFRWDG